MMSCLIAKCDCTITTVEAPSTLQNSHEVRVSQFIILSMVTVTGQA